MSKKNRNSVSDILERSLTKFVLSNTQDRKELRLFILKKLTEHRLAIQNIGVGYSDNQVKAGIQFLLVTKFYKDKK